MSLRNNKVNEGYKKDRTKEKQNNPIAVNPLRKIASKQLGLTKPSKVIVWCWISTEVM
jgi:hypothetical protein